MIVIVRHGRTASNASGLLLGRSDPPLDELGRGQAVAIAASLDAIDRVISSPLLRTRQTAEAFGQPVGIDDRLIELDYGEWDGRPVSEVSAAEWSAWRADPEFAPPGGESLAALGRRVRAALDDYADEDGLTVLVTHVSPVKASVAWSLGVGDEAAWRLFVAQASITRIDTSGSVPRLVGFNDVGHLATP